MLNYKELKDASSNSNFIENTVVFVTQRTQFDKLANSFFFFF